MLVQRVHATFLGLVSLSALLALWYYVAISGAVPAGLLPSPSAVALRVTELARTEDFWRQAGITLLRLTVGLGIAVIVGVGLGLAAATSKWGRDLIQPLVRVLAPIPKIALYPALVLTLGFDDASKIALVAIEAMFPILLATYQGGRLVEPKLLWCAEAMGMSRAMLPLCVVLPAAAPSVLVGVRIGLVIGCVVVFLAEMISSTDGLGHLLAMAARTFQVVDIFVPLIAISTIGLICSILLTLLHKKVVH